jgi:hypothetical protein
VATKQVNIDIIAKDKTRQAMQSATKGVDGLKSAVFNLRNAFIGLGAGLAIKSFIDVGKSIESLQIRLKYLFGSVEEGAKAFDVMSKYASKVPFSLGQIQAGAGNLAIVSKNADELAKMLEITGTVASVAGLDFATTAEQIQRSFSSGISSADIFREKGVKAMLGFSAGAVVSVEETIEAFKRVFGKTGGMAGATKDLANTLEGTLSMIGDKVLSFQQIVAKSFFVGLKQEFGALDKALQDNKKTIDNIAKAVGKGLSDAVIMAGDAVVFLKDNFELLKALAIGAVVFKIAGAFRDLAKAIGLAKGALLLFGRANPMLIMVALIGTVVALAEAFKKAEEPNKKLNDLIKQQQLLTLQLSKAGNISEKALQDQLATVNKQIEAFNNSRIALAMKTAGEKDALITSKEYIESQLKGAKLLADAQKEKNKLAEAEFGLRGSDFDAISGGINFDDKLAQTMEMAKLEADVNKQAFENKYKVIQEQDELLAELERIRAEDKLTLVYETAEKEKAIRKKAFDDNFNLIKSGKAGEINLDKMAEKDKTDLAVKVGRDALDQLAQNNKKAFALNKAFKMADAIMSTAQGVSSALGKGNIPLAIAIGVFGAVQVATIMSQKYQGRKQGGRMNQGQPYLVGEAGPEVVVPDKASNVVPNGQLGGMGKQVNVNFNITTVDATGFSELLVNSRATIVNVINQALNEKGKEVLV